MTPENEFKGFIFKQINQKFCRCFWPLSECKNDAIRAHSIQNRQVLETLERNGHVVMVCPNLDFEAGPSAKFKETGRKKASTFTGLCSKHDNMLFQPIDDNEFDLKNSEHLFLLAYRSVLKGLHAAMKAAVDVQSGYIRGVQLGKFQADTPDPDPVGLLATEKLFSAYQFDMYKVLYDEAFITKSWQKVHNYTFGIETEIPTLAASSVFSTDFFSNKTNGLAYVALNVFPQGGKTHVVFSCLKRHKDDVLRYLRNHKIFDQKNLPATLSKLILKKCENFVLSPIIFEKFSLKQIEVMENYFLLSAIDHEIKIEDPRLYLFGRVE